MIDLPPTESDYAMARAFVDDPRPYDRERQTETLARLFAQKSREGYRKAEATISELQTDMTRMVSSSLARQVREFMNAFGHDVKSAPEVPDEKTVRLRLRLIVEELFELVRAAGYRQGICSTEDMASLAACEQTMMRLVGFIDEDVDMPEFVDAIADLYYVLEGTAAAFGVHMKPIQDAVHASNMAKAGGKIDEHGKLRKPDGWKPPDVRGLLIAQGWKP